MDSQVIQFIGKYEKIQHNFDYFFLDGSIHSVGYYNLKKCNVDFITIGADYYKDKKKSLYLIKNKIDDVDFQDKIKKNFILNFERNVFSEIDKISEIGVGIKTNKNEDEFIERLIKLMIINGAGKIFRFYDPRVILFVNIYLDLTSRKFYSNIFDEIYVIISANIFKVNINKKNYNLKFFDLIALKKILSDDGESDGFLIQDKINNLYKELEVCYG